MRGAMSHDGKMSGNRQMVDRYDESKGAKKEAPKPGADAGEKDGEKDIHSVVAEHGPAHTHIITQGKAGKGSHHSETHHEDGHSHHADHDSLDEAHEHGTVAMGEEPEGDEAENEPEMNAEPPMGGGGGGFMPPAA